MKKLVLYIAASSLLLISLLIASYLFFVFPDDRQVSELAADEPASGVQEFVASVLKSGLAHSLNMDVEAYRQMRPGLDSIVATGVVTESRRFVSPYQVLAPAGRYPWRLEAWDGLAVPDGHELTVSVPTGAESLEITVRDGSEGEVKVGATGDPRIIRTTGWSEGKWYPALLDKNVKKYLYLGRYPLMPRWRQYRIGVAGAEEVKITCKSADGWCIVGDPTFYRPGTERKPRQTIMIMVDTLRGDALKPGVMPKTDSFAAEAMRFQRAIAPGNMTSPSTNSILACRPPTELGKVAFAYSIDRDSRELFYKDQPKSFPAVLQEAGVRTAMIGNISVISEVFGVGVSHGFDQQLLTEPEGYETALAVSEAIRWVKENRSKDFLLYVHLNNPHAPYRPPLHHLFSQFHGLSDLSNYTNVVKWLYRGEVAYADDQIGRLLKYLKTEGLYDQVDIVLTSDHGDQHQERKFTGNEIAQDFSGVYFDHGATLLNDEVHVPLVIRRAGRPAVAVEDFVTTLWLGRTILGFYQLPEEKLSRCVGMDLSEGRADNSLLIGSEGFQARSLIIDGRYKYIKTYEPTEKRVYASDRLSGEKKSFFRDEQLYDLKVDPDETTDLKDADPALLQKARRLFRSYFGISSSYELVLEHPGRAEFEISAKEPELLLGRQENEVLKVTPKGFSGHFDESLRLKIKYAKDMELPEIRINETVVPLKVTTLKLPWPGAGTVLPEESLDWLRERSGPSATLVLVRDDRRRDRRISLGNPAFEKVLREWGYLNEN